MGEDKKDSKDSKDRFITRDSKKFFDNGRLVITSSEVVQRKYDGSRKIYIDNVSGTTFVDSGLQRNMAALVFVLGLITTILIYLSEYDRLFLIFPLFICAFAIFLFISSTNKILIQSNASIMSITQNLGFNESFDDIQRALDDAKKYSRK